MKLKCRNIGKLSSAEVDINTITLIAGLNSTGKSTVGKLLYCIFNSFYNFEEEATSTLKNFIRNQFFETAYPFPSIDECVEELYKLRFQPNKEIIETTIKEFAGERFFTKKNKLVSERVLELLNLSNDEIYKWILQAKFYSEFGNQIQNIFLEQKNSTVDLCIKNSEISVGIKENKIYSLKNFQNLKTETIYIDDPFVLDNLSQRSRYFGYGRDHKSHLQRKLSERILQDSDMDSAIKDLLTTKKLENIYNKIDFVCKGNIVSSKTGFSFQYEDTKEILNIGNLSTGLKTFSIIKTLLLNGTLTQNGTIILDEPEIHLHPEWQKLLAEIIVLIQKEFDMHILINSHSPYFIKAIDVYAKKYKIRKTCKFYLAKDDESHKTAQLKDVSNNLEEIYRLLFIPLQELEDERSEIESEDSND
ncbi:MAG: AAA family ATPase [Treponema sp.]|uniref:AAA family ATPase n=1 Tax=Treponema sp. TaxID=166 RepID=UPI0025808B07|nr:AAA family ATPase [Treponema sp.]MDD6970633.1 AAA family ATPase [Spirochaetales bacterium]MDY6190974.1 AAA family ATPase [Treponema sp.]